MSGGVDSSVAALLLKEQGCDLIGATMKLYDHQEEWIRETANDSAQGKIAPGVPPRLLGLSSEPEDEEGVRTCCALSDVEDARRVAFALKFPYYVFNYTRAFDQDVLAPFAHAYENGLTPNPCVFCNRRLKFGALLDRAIVLGCTHVATGHYARVLFDELSGRWQLLSALDQTKDQTYMLYTLTQEQLSHILFPLGDYDKPAIRALAEEHGLVNARKKDSQDICFVQSGSYADFIERYTGRTYPPGNFVDMNGRVLGRHKGIIHYTLGQRKGLGLALPASMFVVRLDMSRNEVVLGFTEDLMHRRMIVRDINLIAAPRLEGDVRALVKARYSHKASPAMLRQTGHDEITVIFDEPQRAITPGQAAVFYISKEVKAPGLEPFEASLVLGGGTITEAAE